MNCHCFRCGSCDEAAIEVSLRDGDHARRVKHRNYSETKLESFPTCTLPPLLSLTEHRNHSQTKLDSFPTYTLNPFCF